MPPTFDETFAGIGQAAGDQARAGINDIQNKYQEFLTGRPAPMTSTIGDMEYTTAPTGEAAPQSYDAALRQYSNMEQAELRTRHEADPSATTTAQTAQAETQPWMQASGGMAGLDERQMASAQRSYAAWAEAKPAYAERHDFADYVQYVQGRAAERDGQVQAPDAASAAPATEVAAQESPYEPEV